MVALLKLYTSSLQSSGYDPVKVAVCLRRFKIYMLSSLPRPFSTAELLMVEVASWKSVETSAPARSHWLDSEHLYVIVKQNFPRNRAALSLLSYCYYQMQDYKAATTMYEQLVKVCPTVEEYKVRFRDAGVQDTRRTGGESCFAVAQPTQYRAILYYCSYYWFRCTSLSPCTRPECTQKRRALLSESTAHNISRG